MTVTARRRLDGLPHGFCVQLDADVRRLPSGGWAGPRGIIRLTEAGRHAWAELGNRPVRTQAGARLGRRLTDAGFAHPVPPPVAGKPDITVVIPVRDRAPELDRCLQSLSRVYPVVVVDDASSDELGLRAVAARHGATLVRLQHNAGPAQARNVGLQQSRSELVAFVDSDTVPGHRWITELAAHFADDAVALVAPRVVALPSGTFAGRYTRARCNLDLGGRQARVHPYGRVSYVPSAALLARRVALSDVTTHSGAFDPALRIGEDVDLVWRLHKAGWRIRYQPAERVAHQEPTSWHALLRRRATYGTSSALLAVRHPHEMAPLIVHPWPAACLAATVLRRPVAAALCFAGTVNAMRATARAGGLTAAEFPTQAILRHALSSVAQTWIGVGRYTTQFAAPLLTAGLLARRRRLATAGLLLAPLATAWRGRTANLNPVHFTAGYLADEIAYGSGVLAGCLRERTVTPLRPVRRPRSN